MGGKVPSQRPSDKTSRGGPREFGWIEWLRNLEAQTPVPAATIGLGDDAAVWRPHSKRDVVLTVDTQVAGVHFRREWLSERQLARRAVSASVSDLAAMAARPRLLLVAVTAPNDTTTRQFQELHRGLREEAKSYGARIIGGNLSSGPLSLSITAIGEVAPGAAVPRSGARPGHEIWVTGSPGLSGAGLRSLSSRGGSLSTRRRAVAAATRAARNAYLKPHARVQEALALRRWKPTALIDISDGLAADLGHVLKESSHACRAPLGAELDRETLGACPHLEALGSVHGLPPEVLALEPSDDYELCLTVPPARGREARRRAFEERFGIPITLIGHIVSEAGLFLRDAHENRVAVTGLGWDHFGA